MQKCKFAKMQKCKKICHFGRNIMPGLMEQREQSQTRLNFAESRLKKTISQLHSPDIIQFAFIVEKNSLNFAAAKVIFIIGLCF